MPQHLARRPRARGGASRVPFKRPHHPPLTSGCLSARARVPRRSAPPRPQPRRRQDERRPGERAALLGPPVRLRRRLFPTPAPAAAAARPSPRTMSVAGLKKQFHKATQVRRLTGAPRGGPGRSREGRARSLRPAGSAGTPACAQLAVAALRVARPARRGCGGAGRPGAGSPPSVPHPGLGEALRTPASPWRPALSPRAPSPHRPRTAPRGSGWEGTATARSPRRAGAPAARREIM